MNTLQTWLGCAEKPATGGVYRHLGASRAEMTDRYRREPFSRDLFRAIVRKFQFLILSGDCPQLETLVTVLAGDFTPSQQMFPP